MKNLIMVILTLVTCSCADNGYYYSGGQRISLTPIESLNRAINSIDYYENSRGVVLGVSDKLIVKVNSTTSIESIASEFNLIIEKEIAKDTYLLKASTLKETITITNRLSEDERVLYAHPDFLKKYMRR